MLQVAAGIEQRAESHVAANARKTIKISEFHGSTPQSWQPGAVLPSPQEMSDGSISIVSAALRGVKSAMGSPLPPTFSDLRILKGLEPTHLGSAHSKGVMQETRKN